MVFKRLSAIVFHEFRIDNYVIIDIQYRQMNRQNHKTFYKTRLRAYAAAHVAVIVSQDVTSNDSAPAVVASGTAAVVASGTAAAVVVAASVEGVVGCSGVVGVVVGGVTPVVLLVGGVVTAVVSSAASELLPAEVLTIITQSAVTIRVSRNILMSKFVFTSFDEIFLFNE